MRITPNTLKRLHVLLNATGLIEEKPILVQQYSGRRATSSKDLTEAEAAQLCRHLETQPGGQPVVADPAERDAADVMRKKLFHLAHSLGWETVPGGPVDRQKLENWIRTRTSLKKPMMAHTLAELPGLVTQMETLYLKCLLGS